MQTSTPKQTDKTVEKATAHEWFHVTVRHRHPIGGESSGVTVFNRPPPALGGERLPFRQTLAAQKQVDTDKGQRQQTLDRTTDCQMNGIFRPNPQPVLSPSCYNACPNIMMTVQARPYRALPDPAITTSPGDLDIHCQFWVCRLGTLKLKRKLSCSRGYEPFSALLGTRFETTRD